MPRIPYLSYVQTTPRWPVWLMVLPARRLHLEQALDALGFDVRPQDDVPDIHTPDRGMSGLVIADVPSTLGTAFQQWRQSSLGAPLLIYARASEADAVTCLIDHAASGWIAEHPSQAELAQAMAAATDGIYWLSPSLGASLVAWVMAHSTAHKLEANSSQDSAPIEPEPIDSSAPWDSVADQHALGLNTPGVNEFEPLTPREIAALRLARNGLTNKAIARELHISDNTVKKHLARAYEKLGIHRRRQLFGPMS